MSDDIDKLKEAFDEAEKAAKDIENIVGNIDFPAINELRYAGYHLFQYLKASDDESKKDQFNKCYNHSKRAYYDSYETGLAYYFDAIKTFQKNYSLVYLSHFIEDYRGKKKEVIEIQKWLSNHTKRDNRDQYYREAKLKFDELKSIYEHFEEHREKINYHIKIKLSLFIISVLLIPFLIAGGIEIVKYNFFSDDACSMTKIMNLIADAHSFSAPECSK